MISLRRKKRRNTENIVPMINVAFLLLIFFLMSAVIAPSPPVEVDLPKVLSGEQGEGVAIYLAEDGRLLRETGEIVMPEALAGQSVSLFAPSALEAKDAVRLLRKIQELGVSDVSLAANTVDSNGE